MLSSPNDAISIPIDLKKHAATLTMQRGLRQAFFDAVVAGDLQGLAAALVDGAPVTIVAGPAVPGFPQGFQAIQIAAWQGHADVVRMLLDRGATVRDAAPPAGYQALHAAAAKGRDGVVGLLLQRGADVNATTGRWGL